MIVFGPPSFSNSFYDGARMSTDWVTTGKSSKCCSQDFLETHLICAFQICIKMFIIYIGTGELTQDLDWNHAGRLCNTLDHVRITKNRFFGLFWDPMKRFGRQKHHLSTQNDGMQQYPLQIKFLSGTWFDHSIEQISLRQPGCSGWYLMYYWRFLNSIQLIFSTRHHSVTQIPMVSH